MEPFVENPVTEVPLGAVLVAVAVLVKAFVAQGGTITCNNTAPFSPAAKLLPAAKRLLLPVPLKPAFAIKSSEVMPITVGVQGAGKAASKSSTICTFARFVVPMFCKLNSKVTKLEPLALLSVFTTRFAKPSRLVEEVLTGVVLLLLPGLPSPSGSGLAPFVETSVTEVPLGAVPVKVAVLLNEVVVQAGMRMVSNMVA